MIIKSLHLRNVRSYVDEKIDFPEGSCVLSGDIGSGKSTILLAIEFGLFGVKKGDLSGSTLLRHGAKEGFVSLHFSIKGHDVVVHRQLKRGKRGISQEAGHVIIDDVKSIGTPEELKATVLDLLGYPKEFLKKKDLMYRYTVYTPQEAMKRIIYESKDVRLDTLRKVFNIDKYKTIVDNVKIVVSGIREKRRALEGFTSDLEEKKESLSKIREQHVQLEKKVHELGPVLGQVKKELEMKSSSFNELEKKMQEFAALAKELSILEMQLTQFGEQHKQTMAQTEVVRSRVKELDMELAKQDIAHVSTLGEQISKKEKELRELEESSRSVMRKMQEITSKIEIKEQSVHKIVTLDSCPMCLQHVAHEHKDRIKQEAEQEVASFRQQVAVEQKKEKHIDAAVKMCRKQLDELRMKHSSGQVLLQKQKHVEQQRVEILRLNEQVKKIAEMIQTVSKRKEEISVLQKEREQFEKEYGTKENELDAVRLRERDLAISVAQVNREIEVVEKRIGELHKEIAVKEQALSEVVRIQELQDYLQDFFVKLVSRIERHVLYSVHNEFNDVFREWFNMLMQDETLHVRLDDEFTPVIEQNGFDTSLDNLSGGEKTSVALSYRLALNKVINDVVEGINTRDVLMLDEPTDGFSDEQLDNVRDVIRQFAIKQLIIVSHEPKIESFVDQVIRVSKEDHVSRVEVVG